MQVGTQAAEGGCWALFVVDLVSWPGQPSVVGAEMVLGAELEREGFEVGRTWHSAGEGWSSAVSFLADSQGMLYLLSHKSSSCRNHCHYICSIEPFQGFVFQSFSLPTGSISNLAHHAEKIATGAWLASLPCRFFSKRTEGKNRPGNEARAWSTRCTPASLDSGLVLHYLSLVDPNNMVPVSRCEISQLQKAILLQKFKEGMQGCGHATLALRQAAASETGLKMCSINVRT